MSPDQAILLQRPIDGRVFLEVLEGIRRPAQRVCHIYVKNIKKKRVSPNAGKWNARVEIESMCCGELSGHGLRQKPRLVPRTVALPHGIGQMLRAIRQARAALGTRRSPRLCYYI